MPGLSPADHESIMLGLALTYGSDAIKWALPDLTHDKFIYSKELALGQSPDHMRIWQAITQCWTDKVSPTIPAVMDRLSGHDYFHYLGALVTSLRGSHQIYEPDPRYIVGLAKTIDKTGMAYRQLALAHTLGKTIDDPAEFAKYVGQIDDVDEWSNNMINQFRTVSRPTNQGYVHASSIVDKVKEGWYRIWAGEQFMILPCGLPSLTQVGLFPVGRLAVIHGRSNGGKSAFVRQVCLGTAMGLLANGIKGCVAINSLEEDQESVIAELAAKLARVNLFKLWFGKDGMTQEEQDRLLYWVDYVGSLPLFVDSTNLLTTSALEYRLDSLHTSDKGPVWQICVDYLELLKSKAGDKESKEQVVHAVASNLFTITRTTGASGLLVSQSSYGKQGAFNKEMIAGGTGLRYSEGIYHVADVVYENVNYPEMTRKGVNFEPAEGLDELSAWGLMQKGRGMPVCDPIRWQWQPEYTLFVDPLLNKGRKDEDTIAFEHLLEAQGEF